MASFESHIDSLIEKEGGYKLINVKHDAGGLTFAGISKRSHPESQVWYFLSEGNQQEAIKEVRLIYKSEYWDKFNGDAIKNNDVAEQMLSCAVLSGVGTAVKFAQLIVGVKVDGVCGPKTIAAINKFDPELFDARFALLRIFRFNKIARKKTQLGFLRGWINRVFHEVEDD